MTDYRSCRLCPRQCGVDRTAGERGFCGCGHQALVAKTMLHSWEEPVLTGSGKSGAIFFGGCTLGCRYCQNRAISGGPTGKAVDSPELRRLMEELIAQGADNIDLVTPTHFLPTVAGALEEKLPVPVVYNCGGYERPEVLSCLEGKEISCRDGHPPPAAYGSTPFACIPRRNASGSSAVKVIRSPLVGWVKVSE